MLLHARIANLVLLAPFRVETVVSGFGRALLQLLRHGRPHVHLVLVGSRRHALLAYLHEVRFLAISNARLVEFVVAAWLALKVLARQRGVELSLMACNGEARVLARTVL